MRLNENILWLHELRLADLARVGGIGGAKLARYGERVLEALGAVG